MIRSPFASRLPVGPVRLQALPPSALSNKAVPFNRIFYTALQKTKGLLHKETSLFT